MKAQRAVILTAAVSLLAAPALLQAQEEKEVMPSKTIHEQTAQRSQEVVDQLLRIATPQTAYDYVNFYLSGPVVVLTGFTTKGVLKSEAEQQVQKLKWVEHVVNEIKILKIDTETRQLRRQVLGMLEEACPRSFPENHADIRIGVSENFDITLVGIVNPGDKETFEAALVQIKNLPLVEKVTNQTLVSS